MIVYCLVYNHLQYTSALLHGNQYCCKIWSVLFWPTRACTVVTLYWSVFTFTLIVLACPDRSTVQSYPDLLWSILICFKTYLDLFCLLCPGFFVYPFWYDFPWPVLYTNMFWPDLSWHILSWTDMPDLSTCLYMSWPVLTSPDLYRPVLICSKHVLTSPILS